MDPGTLKDVIFRAIACAVPAREVDNQAYEPLLGTEGLEKFAAMTGIRTRHHADERQTPADLAQAAIRAIFKSGKARPEEIDVFVFISQMPDYILPATACVLHGRLGLKKTCMAFDVNLGCSGYVYGLAIAAALLAAPGAKALVCGGDCISQLTSPRDKSAAPLFGDAGFATVLEKSDVPGVAGTGFWTDGTGARAILGPAGQRRHPHGNAELRVFGEGIWRGDQHLALNGTDVFTFTITEVPRAIEETLQSAQVARESIDLLVMHQANLYILKTIAKKLAIPMDKVPVSLDRYGNTSSASIPLTLCDALAGRTTPNPVRALLAGFGVGLSWGTAVVDIDPGVCLPILQSDAVFADGDQVDA